MVTFILIRHGFSQFNKERRFTGQCDVPLDEVGVQQAKQTAAYVAKNFKIDAIYSSDLSRAYQTAKPLADALGLEIQTSRALRERDVGYWQGLTFDEVRERYPEGFAFYSANIGESRCGDGENFAEVRRRISAELDRIAAENDGRTVVIASHGGAIRALLCEWQHIPLEEMADMPNVPNASVTVAEYDHGNVKLLRVGDNGHLDDQLSERAAR
ncbi:MAG: histidine phosphatase family protein [Clostridia bacterium]|nr:histidine phosphatase family protein [Clostridia bacterium]